MTTRTWRRTSRLFGLGHTTAELAAVRRRWKALLGIATAFAPAAKTAPRRARGARAKPQDRKAGAVRLKEIRAFGPNPGALRMLAGVPAGLGRSAPLVVVLHGCGQSALAYDRGSGWSETAATHGFAVLYPEQRKANNPHGCFSWFQESDVTRENGEVESIRAMIEHAVAAYDLDPGRVFITGLSAGAAMANAMLATHPELFSAGALIAGLPYGAATGVTEAFHAMMSGRERAARDWGDAVRAAAPEPEAWPRIAVWHGTADDTVRPLNAGETVKQWLDVHGVAKGKARTLEDGRLRRRTWTDGAGAPLVEEVLVDDMGHGTPVDGPVDGEDGRYFLDVGVASTRLIAASWGLLP